MSSRGKSFTRLILPAFFLIIAAPPGNGAENRLPQSCSAGLEAAAAALADSQFDVADRRFAELSKDSSNSAFVRGLAVIGVAETALARKDTAAAIEAWRWLAADNGLPRWHRDLAQRRLTEIERRQKGLPERDPDAYRTHLAVLPEPAVVFHVAPGGSDVADGSAARPFATLARARDAIREIKKSRGGTLPKGGVRVVVQDGSFSLKDPF